MINRNRGKCYFLCEVSVFGSAPSSNISKILPQKLDGERLTLGASAGGVGLLLSRLSFSGLFPFSVWFAGKVWLVGSDPDSCIWTSRTWERESKTLKRYHRQVCTGQASARADGFKPLLKPCDVFYPWSTLCFQKWLTAFMHSILNHYVQALKGSVTHACVWLHFPLSTKTKTVCLVQE